MKGLFDFIDFCTTSSWDAKLTKLADTAMCKIEKMVKWEKF